MTWLTFEQFCAIGKKCACCEKEAKWVARKDKPAYCDEHFPVEKHKLHKNINNINVNTLFTI